MQKDIKETGKIKKCNIQAHNKNLIRKQVQNSHNIYTELKDVFTGIGCFNGTFSSQTKPESKSCRTPMVCNLCITKCMHGRTRAATSVVLVPKLNVQVRVCLGPARLNQALI